MAIGVYGTIRPADINPVDHAEIWYSYVTDRSQTNTTFTKISSSLLTKMYADTDVNNKENFGGMYNMKLPVEIFGNKGIYTLYIRPKQYRCTISDIGTLTTSSDRRGIIINSGDFKEIDGTPITFNPDNNSLCGYRIEYLTLNNADIDEKKILNKFVIVTSNNKVEPVQQNLTNNIQKSVRYRFNDAGSLIFLEVTPNSAPTSKPNALPDIGQPSQEIILSNTFFTPVSIEIEMVENSIDTLSYMLSGNQIMNRETGVITTYTPDNNIYKQTSNYTIKNSNGTPIYSVRENREEIDFSQDFNEITSLKS